MTAFFVTGTDTGIGKTRIACALLHRFAQAGYRVAGMKPVAAGVAAGAALNEDVLLLRSASNVDLPQALTNPYSFREAVAPHIAAAAGNIVIEISVIATAFNAIRQQAEVVIVEGAGGFYVPLGEDFDTADLAQTLNLPVILVVGMRLGCLNHALLTAEAIERRGLPLAGWVANCVDENMAYLKENIATLNARIAAPLLGVIPHERLAAPAAVAAFIDLKKLAC